MQFDEFLKARPSVLLILTVILVAAMTPAVFLFAQNQAQTQAMQEFKELQAETFYRLRQSDKTENEIQARIEKLENDVQSLKIDLAQMRVNLDIALKSAVEAQKQKTDSQK